jgi:hypothetical protein
VSAFGLSAELRSSYYYMPTTYLAPPQYIKTFGTRGSKVKSEYHIQDVGRPGAGIPNILEE